MTTNNTIILLAAALLLAGTVSAQQEIFSEPGEFTAGGDPSANQHAIAVEAGTTVEVIVVGNGIDTTLTAVLPDGTTISNDDYRDLDAGFTSTVDVDGEISVTAAPLSDGTTGSYRIVARTLPPATEITIDQSVSGSLGAGSGDRYELAGTAGTRIAIDLKSYDFDPFLTVVDSIGNERTDDDGGDEGLNSRLAYRFDRDETITITAGRTGSSTGRYELSVSTLPSEPAERHTGALSNESQRGYDGTRYRRYEIDGEAGELLTVELKSNAFDPVLYIANPDGSNLARDDDGGTDNNSLAIVTLPETGTYAIFVTSLGGATGTYELTIYR